VSIEAILAELAQARELLNGAYQHGRVATERLSEAVGTLTELSLGHPGSLVPQEFALADQLLATGSTALAAALAALDAFAAAL
jgi:hypothetical protein